MIKNFKGWRKKTTTKESRCPVSVKDINVGSVIKLREKNGKINGSFVYVGIQ